MIVLSISTIPMYADDVVESSNEEDSGLVFRIQYRLNEQFYITIPISGEKAKVQKEEKKGRKLFLHFGLFLLQL